MNQKIKQTAHERSSCKPASWNFQVQSNLLSCMVALSECGITCLFFFIKFELLVIIMTIKDLENCRVILVYVGLFIAYVRLKESHQS